MKSLIKQIITILILTSFLSIVLFSSNMMMQGPDGRMIGDCPLSAMGVSLCPQDTVAVAVHHISAYYAFLNVPLGSYSFASIVFLSILASAILVIFVYSPKLGPPKIAKIIYDLLPVDTFCRKISHWLSLFENSPSFA